jgi:histidinol-phosphate/aromatic aminotransferase/cobyric acid decarboxylase-like protein
MTTPTRPPAGPIPATPPAAPGPAATPGTPVAPGIPAAPRTPARPGTSAAPVPPGTPAGSAVAGLPAHRAPVGAGRYPPARVPARPAAGRQPAGRLGTPSPRAGAATAPAGRAPEVVDRVALRHHGDRDAEPGLLDLAVNVRPGGPPDWLRERLRAAVDDLGRYPDPSAAVAAVARRHARPEADVLLTAGATEAFVLLARAFRPRRAVCVHPSFTEPELALRSAGRPVERLILAPPYELDPAAVPVDADLVVLGNPTNPTGVLHDPEAIASLARPGRVLVVDEAFADTVPGERASLAARGDLPGLVVVRSLTKTWGLAGLRVGYLLAPPEYVAVLAAAQPHWPVSTPALAAVEACCAPEALAEADGSAARLAGWRDILRAAVPLAAESATSFVLLHLDNGAAVRDRLRAGGIAVRRGETFPGLTADHLRVAVRDPATTRRFTSALAAAVAGTTP